MAAITPNSKKNARLLPRKYPGYLQTLVSWGYAILLLMGAVSGVLLFAMIGFEPTPVCNAAGECVPGSIYHNGGGGGGGKEKPPKTTGDCGNGICEEGEGAWNCVIDCGDFCPDQVCSPGEVDTCPEDCPVDVTCGDGICSAYENGENCPSDCEPPTPTHTLAAPTLAQVPVERPTSTQVLTPRLTKQATQEPQPVPPAEQPTTPTNTPTPTPEPACRTIEAESIAPEVVDAAETIILRRGLRIRAKEASQADETDDRLPLKFGQGSQLVDVWIICDFPPEEVCLPVAGITQEDFSRVRLLDCNSEADTCRSIAPASWKNGQVCFDGGIGPISCAEGCVVQVSQLVDPSVYVVPLVVILVILGIIVFVIILALVRRRPEEEEEERATEPPAW